jgi:hypothetical protein
MRCSCALEQFLDQPLASEKRPASCSARALNPTYGQVPSKAGWKQARIADQRLHLLDAEANSPGFLQPALGAEEHGHPGVGRSRTAPHTANLGRSGILLQL